MSDRSTTSFSRNCSLEQLSNRWFDVLVVGAGITGAGVALDAASRGLSVALVDKGDLASGTSSKSSKLVHGGLRYLQQGEIGLVYQALLERQRLLRNASHLVQGLPFVLPILKKGGIVDRRIARALGLALWQYDLTGGARLGRHRRLNVSDIRNRFPNLREDLVAAGYLYWDAWADDARLTLSLARTAALDYGAVVVTYSALTGVDRVDGQVKSATIEVDGRSVNVACGTVVNACGVWAEEVQDLTGVADTFDIRPAKGVHISVPSHRLPVEVAFVLPVRTDRRSVFVLPWLDGYTYIGTTDTDYDGDLNEPLCTRSDRDYLLDAVNALTSASLTERDITGSWAGLRPLVATGEKDRTSDLSRRHLVRADSSGVITVTGGKLTTYRRMAQDVVDAICSFRGEYRRCRTRRLLLRGVGDAVGDSRLERRYGCEIENILSLIHNDASLGEVLIPGLPYLRAEAVYAVEEEMAITLDDVLSRRTRARLENRRATLLAAPNVAELLASFAGWSDERRRAEVIEFQKSVNAEIEAESL